MSNQSVIKVGSRKSQLALIQTEFIIGQLKKYFPDFCFEIVTLDTIGDLILDKALPKIGEKALFTKELEDALLAGNVDFIVHSLKDLPTQLPSGLGIGTIFERDDKHDAVIMHSKHKGCCLKDLPAGSIVGTSSLRRIAQLKRKYPDLEYESIRGNLNTRLRKLEEDNKYDAIVLAVAGIHRMNWHGKISEILRPPDILYAVGQGALAVEVRSNDNHILDIVSKLTHIPTLICCATERAYLRSLDGGCSVPVGVSVDLEDNEIAVEGWVLSLDGQEVVRDGMRQMVSLNTESTNMGYLTDVSISHIIVPANLKEAVVSAEQCGVQLGNKLLNKGAAKILTEAQQINKTS